MDEKEREQKFSELFSGERYVVAYDASGKNEHAKRVTVTNTFLRKISKVYVFLAGAEKKEAFQKMKSEGSLKDAPARILKEIPGNIYLDKSIIE